MTKILFLDIETSPHLVYTWGMYKQNISVEQVIRTGKILSIGFAMGDSEVAYANCQHTLKDGDVDDSDVIILIHQFLDAADIVVAHNGDKFDVPYLNRRFVQLGLPPPSPYKTIDTYKIAAKSFRFPSNSLAGLSEQLDLINKKTKHKKFPGFSLWRECLDGNDEAWEKMKEYNVADVLALRELYYKIRSWAKTHPNVSLFKESRACTTCGSTNLVRRGFAYTNTQKYQRFRCKDCGSWSRTRFTEVSREAREKIIVKAV